MRCRVRGCMNHGYKLVRRKRVYTRAHIKPFSFPSLSLSPSLFLSLLMVTNIGCLDPEWRRNKREHRSNSRPRSSWLYRIRRWLALRRLPTSSQSQDKVGTSFFQYAYVPGSKKCTAMTVIDDFLAYDSVEVSVTNN